MINKILLYICVLATIVNASCTYELNINFNFNHKNIEVKANIYDKEKSLDLDISGFEIENMNNVKNALNDGSNHVSFTYKKSIENLDENYIYLMDNWYPQSLNRCRYILSTTLDKSYKNVYENTDKQIDHATFISSKNFVIHHKTYNGITLKTYFLNDNIDLSQKYINKSIEYIKLYEKLIGPYPYREFKIVENIYQTGYSMPTYTLIGSRLLNKPYVLNQSLGHEILHQYFGNAVFNDYKKGNWVEGLTTYLADDFYKKMQNDDATHRKSILNEYSEFVNEKNEFTIKEFEQRQDKPSMLIGYSKLSFVFHMLEKKIGTQKFHELIKKLYLVYKFEEINLEKLAAFFDNNTKIDLKDFFTQWLHKKGMIDFNIEHLNNYYDKDGFWLSFEVVQDENNFFKFDLPLSVKTYDGDTSKIIPIMKARESIKLNFTSEILGLIFDKNIDLFRKLSEEEKPLSISSLMNEKNLIAVVNKNDEPKYRFIKTLFPQIKIMTSQVVKFKDIKENSVIFLDANNELSPQFYPKMNIDKNNTYLIVKPHVYNETKKFALLNYGKYKNRYLMLLQHYSRQSEIIFSEKNISKNTHQTSNGISIELNSIPIVEKIKKLEYLDSILEEIKDKRIIYIGEAHTTFSHHLNQLRVIKALHESGKKVAIAMEMFQVPFQKDLDEYTQGKTSLEEFLKNTEYFKRWKFDFNLYKPIIDYARQHKIKIVAINLDRTITKQVSKEGLFSLDKEQKKSVATHIDQSNLMYKKSLMSIFKEHAPTKSNKDTKDKEKNPHSPAKINLDYFYQSQLIWDETMAENIHNYIKEEKDVILVVIAGVGHIQEHDGIPSRVFRRNALSYQVILNDVQTSKEDDLIIINKNKTSIRKQNKIGVYLKNNDELIVMDLVDNSFASRIGIKKNDLLIQFNGKPIKNLYELKAALYFVNVLDEAVVSVSRHGKQMELKIK